ncbi:hypothetical protein QNZ44_001621 [Enterobacter kobei]
MMNDNPIFDNPLMPDTKRAPLRRVLIGMACHFTSQGLYTVLSADAQACGRLLVTKISSTTLPHTHCNADMVILDEVALREDKLNILSACITTDTTIVVMTDRIFRDTYSLEHNKKIIFIEKSAPVNRLKRSLFHLLLSAIPVRRSSRPEGHQRARMVEREVLYALMKGEKPGDVARRMGISYNAVSRYKMLALKRAGLKSLNALLVRKNRHLYQNL